MDNSEMLTEFIKAFSGSLDPRLWFNLIEEELKEVEDEEEGTEEHLKEVSDLMYVLTGADLVSGDTMKFLVPTEELAKMQVTTLSAIHQLSVAVSTYTEDVLKEAFRRVHESNMSKLGEDGKPILREDGKVLKGPNYKKPDLSDLVGLKDETEDKA